MELANDLQAYLQALYPTWQELRIQNLEKMPAGWECDLYAFNLSYRQDAAYRSLELVLRIYSGKAARGKSLHESIGMQKLHSLGYPVPRVYTVESQPTPIGSAFMIMERIQGEVMGTVFDRSRPGYRDTLLTQLCELFVHLHSLDWKDFVDDPHQIEASGNHYFLDTWITNARQSLSEFDLPELNPVLKWIVKNLNDTYTDRPSVVHRDFHPYNILLRPDGSAVVIDWSSWQVTDYRFDLAWTLMLTYAFSGEDLRCHVLESYERVAGERIKDLHVFEVCACFRRLLHVITSLSHGAESHGMRPEAVELMRSQMEHLQRVLNLLRINSGISILKIEEYLSA